MRTLMASFTLTKSATNFLAQKKFSEHIFIPKFGIDTI